MQKKIGVFVDFTNNNYLVSFLEGISNRAGEQNISVICFEGGHLYQSKRITGSREVLYDLANNDNLDALILPLTSLGKLLKENNIDYFLKRFTIPIVAVGMKVENRPSILLDNKSGMEKLLLHLIEYHKFKKISFIKGPLDNHDAIERYDTFCKVMDSCGIEIDDKIIFQGDYSPGVANQIAKDIYKILKNEKIDAIVSVNDNSALMIQDYLTSKGIRIPDDVAVTGFDNTDLSQNSNPQLTTIEQPTYEIGIKAMDTALALLNGQNVDELSIIGTSPIYRESCGCIDWENSLDSCTSCSEDLFKNVQRKIVNDKSFQSQDLDLFINPLLNLLIESLTNRNEKEYAKKFKELLINLFYKHDDKSKYIKILPLVFMQLGAHLDNPDEYKYIYHLGLNSISLANEKERADIGVRHLRVMHLSDAIIQHTSDLMNIRTKDQFLEECAALLLKVGIDDCIIAVYESENNSCDMCRLVFAMKDGKREIQQNGIDLLYKSEEILPNEIWNEEWNNRNVIIYPIVFSGQSAGFIAFSNHRLPTDYCSQVYSIINYTFSNFCLLTKLESQKGKLSASERGLSLAQVVGKLGSWEWKIKDRIFSMSYEMRKIFGLEDSQDFESLDELISQYVHPNDRVRVQKIKDNVDRYEPGAVIEYRIVLDNKYERWIAATIPSKDKNTNNEEVLIGTVQDITDRKETEKELEDAKAFISNIVDAMPSILIGVTKEGIITQWNNEADRQSGFAKADAIGKRLKDTFPRLGFAMGLVEQAIESGENLFDSNCISRNELGERRIENIAVYPLFATDKEGGVIRVDDVTEQVRIEEMIVQSEKMLSVGGLAAGMAHEINNPLGGIMQTTEVIKDRLTNLDLAVNVKAAEKAGISLEALSDFLEERKIIKMLNQVTNSGKRAADIVSNMLSFSKKSNNARSSHNLQKIMDNSINLCSIDFNLKKQYDFKQLIIDKEYEDELPLVPCDNAKIQQVFMNIIRNATEAMHEKLTKDKGLTKMKLKLRIYSVETSKMVCVEIEDNGIGMDDNTRKRIFEPFFTTKPTDKGTGLGLSVSYFIIVENHNGHLSIESALGQGTKFLIELPME